MKFSNAMMCGYHIYEKTKNYGRLLLARNIHPAHCSCLHAMKDDGTILWRGSQKDLVGH